MFAFGLRVTCALILGCARPQAAKVEPRAVPTATTIDAAPRIVPRRILGRCVQEGTDLRCGWPGSGFAVRFRGTRVAVTLREEGKNLYHVTVDGVARTPLRPERGQEGTYILAENLSPGVHDVGVVKRTDADLGEGVFTAITADGPFEEPEAAALRRVEFVGDSITAGYGVESTVTTCETVSDNENVTESYAALVARTLRVDHHAIAWSGKTVAEVHAAFERALPQRADSTWDFSTWTPDAVVINLGTNDFALVDPGQAKFTTRYVGLLRRVREVYPKAFVLAVLGPMLTDGYPVGRKNLTRARTYIKASVAQLRAGGDKNLDFVEVAEQKHSDGLGCGYHPSKKTHKRMAEQIAPMIKEKLGW